MRATRRADEEHDVTRPQQPELERSGRSSVDQDNWQVNAGAGPTDEAGVAPVPEENQPGHHPEHEQDRPEVPPDQRHSP
ncbi:MAG: hypothetical protein M3N31_04370 [Actinomycetota bacterium]|nr:hypothetical protein [Actinomycetota bacterium]